MESKEKGLQAERVFQRKHKRQSSEGWFYRFFFSLSLKKILFSFALSVFAISCFGRQKGRPLVVFVVKLAEVYVP